jgi:iron-sulfur cluster assembly accessory protein
MITKNSKIGEVIDAYPAAAGVLLKNGVHCLGCSARKFETIGQGLQVHGFSEKEIEKIIAELNQISQKVICVTETAAKKLKELMKKQKKSDYCLRVQAVKGNYGLDFEKEPKDGDEIVKSEGLTFIISEKALPKVRGAAIDYVEIPEPGFSIRGPKK